MYSIDILVEEHKSIIALTEELRKECTNILNGKEIDTDYFEKAVFFARNFGDKYHHQKEEKILFRDMMEKLGPVATQLIRGGMMVEHDFGRLYIGSIADAVEEYKKNPDDALKLDIIANAVGYGNLLTRHIDKEDNAVYTFAERSLSDEDKKTVNDETLLHEEDKNNIEIRRKCLAILEELKGKNNG